MLVVALPKRSLYQLTGLIVLCDCVHMFGVGGVSVGLWRVLCVEGGGLAYGSGHSVPPYAATLCARWSYVCSLGRAAVYFGAYAAAARLSRY